MAPMPFAPGRPLAVLLAISIFSGGIVTLRPAKQPAALTVWTFNRDHAAVYRTLAPEAEVRLMSGRVLDVSLQAVLEAPAGAGGVPDVVEIEISSVGRYLRPPADDIRLWPLDSFLDDGGWRTRLLASRVAVWSKQGVTFGVPLDVHPVALACRADLFAEVGLDVKSADTWPAFQEICLVYQRRWRERGIERQAIELSRTSADVPYMMLLQRGSDLFDADGRLCFDDPRLADTIAFYAMMVAGPTRIAGDTAGDPQTLSRDLTAGRLAAAIMPDWRVDDLDAAVGTLAPAFQYQPLPIFDRTDAPTSTWGGTALVVPRAALRPASSWKLIEKMALSDTARKALFNRTHVLPPTTAPWVDDVALGSTSAALYRSLASRVPQRRVTPFSALALARLSLVLADAVDLADAGNDRAAIVLALKLSLDDAAADVDRVIRFATPQ